MSFTFYGAQKDREQFDYLRAWDHNNNLKKGGR